MSDAWDAEDFEPELPVKINDRWEGEDEDDVKDNWEDEDESKPEGSKEGEDKAKPYQRKKKKLADRIAEKQAEKLAAEEAEQEKNRKLTPEEELSEKLKRQRLQEQSDLELAKEAFGASKGSGLDSMFPENEEEFTKFGEALKNKITVFEKSKHYSAFLEKLCTDLVISLEPDDCRKLGQHLTTLYHEKQKQAKEQDKKKKKKGKITLKSERDNDFNDLASSGANYDYDNFDDEFI